MIKYGMLEIKMIPKLPGYLLYGSPNVSMIQDSIENIRQDCNHQDPNSLSIMVNKFDQN